MDNSNNNRDSAFLQTTHLQDLLHGITNTIVVPTPDENSTQTLGTAISHRGGEATAGGFVSSPVSHNAGDAVLDSQATPQEHPTSLLSPNMTLEPRDDTMPDLEVVSDSSQEDDGNDVEMLPIDEDDDNPAELLQLPSLAPQPRFTEEPLRSNRRARVDDDEDEDRDRRHPSQRAATPADRSNDQPRPTTAPPSGPPPQIPDFMRAFPDPDNLGAPESLRLFQRMFSRWRQNPNPNPQNASAAATQNNSSASDNSNSNNNVDNNNNDQNQQVPAGAPIFGGFTVTLGAGPPPGNSNDNGNASNNTEGRPGPIPNADNARLGMLDMAVFAEIVGRFGAGVGQMFGLETEKEPDDPERAKKLVDGLEEVPVGLVRRLERVGGAPGGHVDGSEGQPSETPGCAICWDSLLDAESDGFSGKGKEENPLPSEESTEAGNVGSSSASQPATNEISPAGPSSSSSESSSTSNPIHPKIVALPCTHVFHATCLIPWFSRPRQTTCPTCRFDIDPENLTYVRRRPQSQAQTGPGPMPGGSGVIFMTAEDGAGDANTREFPSGEAGTNAPPAQQAPATAPPAEPILTEQAGPTPAVANAPPDAAEFEGIWTFGFDIMFEHPQANGERESQQSQGARGADVEMGNAEGVRQEGGIRQESQTPAQGVPEAGINATPTGGTNPDTGVGNTDVPPSPRPAVNGPRPAPPFMAGIARMLGALGGRNGAGGPLPPGIHVFPPAFMPGSNTNRPAATTAVPPPPPPPPPPSGDAPAAGGPTGAQPGGGWNEFAQIFGIAGNGAGGPQGFTFLQGDLLPRDGVPPPPQHRPPPREMRAWTPPPPPGLTLRQRVEQKERDVGLRCFDISCGVGPSDDDPWSDASNAHAKQVLIRPIRNDLLAAVGTSVCSHTFHPACLVSAERVAFGGEEKAEGGDVIVWCPVCRTVGCISSGEWVEGVAALA